MPSGQAVPRRTCQRHVIGCSHQTVASPSQEVTVDHSGRACSGEADAQGRQRDVACRYRAARAANLWTGQTRSELRSVTAGRPILLGTWPEATHGHVRRPVTAARIKPDGRLVEEQQVGSDDDAQGCRVGSAFLRGTLRAVIGRVRQPKGIEQLTRSSAGRHAKPSSTRFSWCVSSSSIEEN